MKNLNKVTLIGHLGKDIEYKTLAEGVSLAKFSIATTESYRDKDDVVKSETDWHNIVAWRNVADNVQKLLKK